MKSIPLKLLVATAVALSIPLAGCGAGQSHPLLDRLRSSRSSPATSPDPRKTLSFGGRERSYLLHVPPAYKASSPIPLVIILHGGTGNATQMQGMCGLDATADKHSFIAVYPNGTGRLQDRLLTWDVEFGYAYALRNHVDDVGFIKALVSDLEGKYTIDRSRVYATGISNGAMLAYLLGSKASDVFAAISPVAGAVGGIPQGGSKYILYPAPAQPVSVIAFHGQQDKMVPYNGGTGRGLTSVTYVPVSQSIGSWVGWDGCVPQTVRTRSSDGNVTLDRYQGGRNGTGVELVTMANGQHRWPQGADYPVAGGEGPSNELMWEFFNAHPKQ